MRQTSARCMALVLLRYGMQKVFSKGAVFKVTIGDLLSKAVKANHMWSVPLLYSGLSTLLFVLRRAESPYTSKPLLPLALRESALAVLRWVPLQG